MFLFFYIQLFKQCVNFFFQHALTVAIKRKIALGDDACSKPLIIIRSHDLRASDMKGAIDEIAS